METDYKKGKRLLSLSAFANYNGAFVWIDDILAKSDGVLLTEDDFETFAIYTAEEK